MNKFRIILIITLLFMLSFVKTFNQCYKVLEIDSISNEKNYFIKLRENISNRYLFIISEKINIHAIPKNNKLAIIQKDSCYVNLNLYPIESLNELYSFMDIRLDGIDVSFTAPYLVYSNIYKSMNNLKITDILKSDGTGNSFQWLQSDSSIIDGYISEDTLIYFYKSKNIIDRYIIND